MTTKARAKVIPDYLIYEMDEGKPIYYHGYQDVLDGKRTLEEIRAETILVCWLKSRLLHLLSKLDKNYISIIGVGIDIDKNNHRVVSIATFKRKNLDLNAPYAKLPPEIVIEIDTKAYIEAAASTTSYYNRKTQQLLDFGVQKVIWIFTGDKKVMVAAKGQDWITSDWNKTIEVIENITLNIKELLEKAKK